jgi:endonuclease V-like protein UPF0215 family
MKQIRLDGEKKAFCRTCGTEMRAVLDLPSKYPRFNHVTEDDFDEKTGEPIFAIVFRCPKRKKIKEIVKSIFSERWHDDYAIGRKKISDL